METKKRYFKLYRIFVSQYLKILMQSKLDFFIGLFGFFLSQMTGIIFLALVFQQIPSLNEWSLEQLLFIYGFAQIPRGLDHLLADNIWMLAWRWIVNGEFDRYMLRPMNLLFQVISEKLCPDALGELIIGTILVVRGAAKGVVTVSFLHVLAFLLSMAAGAVIYTSIKLLFASLAFWVKESAPFLQTAYDMSEFAKYPIEIYPKAVRFVISWIIPFAFVAYLPASYFLKGTSFLSTIGIECIIAVVFFAVSYRIFIIGSRRYESAGN